MRSNRVLHAFADGTLLAPLDSDLRALVSYADESECCGRKSTD
jgi:hypothetical protein